MSTGAKVGLGVGGCLGLLVIVIVVIVVVAALSGGGGSASSAPAPSGAQEEQTAPEETTEEEPAADGQDVGMTASHAGTTGDVIDDTVYTVLDIELTNNGDEELSVNPLYFTVVLDDGSERNDWGETLFADIEPFADSALAPGSSASGQIAVVGEVVATEVRYDPSFGMEDPIVTTVD